MKNDLMKIALNSMLLLGIFTKILWSLLELSLYAATVIGGNIMVLLRVLEISSVLFVLIGFLWGFEKITSKIYSIKTTHILILLFVFSWVLLARINYFVGSNLGSVIDKKISDADYTSIYVHRYSYEHIIYLIGLIYIVFKINKNQYKESG